MAKQTDQGYVIDPDVQRFANLYKSDSDKVFATYETSELIALPKSLFYDAATSAGTYNGLFSYYVLGKGGRGKAVPYALSETAAFVPLITPPESRNPTARAIIDTTSRMNGNGVPAFLDPNSPFRGQLYNVKDFIFCKNYGIIPNNRMVTLRRFPGPTMDSLRIVGSGINAKLDPTTNQVKITKDDITNEKGLMEDKTASNNSTLPVSQAVTYFGEGTGNTLDGLLGINTGLVFMSESQEQMKNEKTGDPGLMNSPFGDLVKSYLSTGKAQLSADSAEQASNLLGTLLSPEKNMNRIKRLFLDQATTGEGPLSKKIFVNVNTVSTMMIRKQGFNGGADPISLVFEYKLTSVGKINTKLLFLDLLTNLLSLGSDYGQFLSPELRLEQTNVGLGFPGGAKGYAQAITNPIQYIRDQMAKLLSSDTVNSIKSAEESLKKDYDQVIDEAKKWVSDPDKYKIDPNGKFYNSVSTLLTDAMLKQIYFQPIMLSGYPTGEWHMVVGNPLNPIAMIGNLVCTNVKISFNEELGPDDFPTELKATYTLQPGRQRHRGDWESMFNRGNGRLYLGQLYESTESRGAFVNATGLDPNDPLNTQSTQAVITNNTSTRN